MNNLTAKQIEQLNNINVNTQQMEFGGEDSGDYRYFEEGNNCRYSG